MLNEGFFAPSQIKTPMRYKPLPPVLQHDFPETKREPKGLQTDIPPSKLTRYVMDIECYTNYFLVKFKNVLTDEVISFEQTKDYDLDRKRIKYLISKSEVITFNGNKYDISMLRLALEGVSCKELKKASDYLIQNGVRAWKFEQDYNLPIFKIKHIDLVELLKGIVSLKIYGGRLHCPKMQDLPIEEKAILTEDEMDEIFTYCDNDLEITKLVFIDRIPQIEIRRVMSAKYKMDLLSKSDAQIAEAVIKAEIEALKNVDLKKPEITKRRFCYKKPDFIQFNKKLLNDALEIVTTKPFDVSSKGIISMPEELTELQVRLGSSIYRMGMGGLHSTEKRAFHLEDEEYSIWDWDVSSYYPSIILNCKLYPKQLGKDFLEVYQAIVTERLEAKKNKDKVKADVLKIVINGSFGKFGSPYSVLYAPDLMVQVTVTGQLSLLMLIEMLESRGIPVVSGNTDGIVIKCPKTHENTMRNIIKRWEKITGFEMESTQYAGIYSRDVNNYIAIKTDGTVKRKGTFAPAGIDKNPEDEICTIAMIEYLKHGTPLEDTIRNCRDITKFVIVKTANGGAIKNGKYLGKAIRWYHAKNEKGYIEYKTNGNMVAMSEGAMPLMTLCDSFPKDVDYDYYINKCKELFG